MTSGTPESTQNWVLAGFQNSLDLASMSPLEAKAMSSSATATSTPRHSSSAPAASGAECASGAKHPSAAGHSAHLRRDPGHLRTLSVWFNQTNTGCDRLVSTGLC